MDVNLSPIWGHDRKKEDCRTIEKYKIPMEYDAFYEPRAGGLYLIDDQPYLYNMIKDDQKLLISYKIAENNLKNKIFTEESFLKECVPQDKIIKVNDEFLKKINKELENGPNIPSDETISNNLLKFFCENSRLGDNFLFQTESTLKKSNNNEDIYLPTMKGKNEIILDPRQLSAYCYDMPDDKNRYFQNIIHELFKEKKIEICSKRVLDEANNFDIKAIRVTNEGRKILQKKINSSNSSNTAFVGMWFDESLDLLYDNVFKPVIKSFDRRPIRVDKLIHGEKIDSRIEKEIQRSDFVVIDLTGEFKDNKYIPRGNVCFEAGLSIGKEKIVIWTCKQDILDSNQLPFDLNHYRILPWKEGGFIEFKEALGKEIEERLKQSES